MSQKYDSVGTVTLLVRIVVWMLFKNRFFAFNC